MVAKKQPCVLHPDRDARLDVTGILICDECFERFREERHAQQGLANRPFYQSLVKAEHKL